MDVALLERRLRDRGLTIEGCSEAVGLGRNTLRRWVNGTVSPLLPPAQRLTDFLDLTVDTLWPRAKAD